ncbi:MAG TPA: methyltransferase domain-containing protein [Verrucomicrobiae bacterium]|nr:methyltransferase domain-containing protein [Verrucomicrobiae bacterium]
MTSHGTLLAADQNNSMLRHVRKDTAFGGGTALINIDDSDFSRLQDSPGKPIGTGPLAEFKYIETVHRHVFHLLKDGLYACAEPQSGVIVWNRKVPSIWESFWFVSNIDSVIPSGQDAKNRLAERARELRENHEPICLHFGCGFRHIKGFFNIDKTRYLGDVNDYFIFDFTESEWPLPDSSVDYIFSEDFIEHIPQKNQLAFLAEAFRVLKTGSYHRVSTPCLYESMKTHADFSKGFGGVYFGEYDRWGHVALFTQNSLREIGTLIGYRHVLFTSKNRGTSPYAVDDYRPGDDRDHVLGNIFADLLK